jgi:hypothetical protein
MRTERFGSFGEFGFKPFVALAQKPSSRPYRPPCLRCY